MKSLPPLRLHCYGPSQERIDIIIRSHHNYPIRREDRIDTDEVFLFDSFKKFSIKPGYAELFFFDIPMTSKLLLNWTHHQEIDWYLNKIQNYNLPYYNLSAGIDHVILQSTAQYHAINMLPYFYQKTEMMTVTDYQNNPRLAAPRISWHYPQIPGNSNHLFTYNKNRSSTLIIFCAIEVEWPESRVVRERLVDYFESVSHPLYTSTIYSRSYATRESGAAAAEKLYLNSKMGIVPAGDSPHSKRFFDMLRAGCIPIVLSDEITTTFEELFFFTDSIMVQFRQSKVDVLGRCINLMNSRIEEIYRQRIYEMNKLHDYDDSSTPNVIKGHEEWGFMWQIYMVTTIKMASQRRNLINTLNMKRFYPYARPI